MQLSHITLPPLRRTLRILQIMDFYSDIALGRFMMVFIQAGLNLRVSEKRVYLQAASCEPQPGNGTIGCSAFARRVRSLDLEAIRLYRP